MSLLRLAARGSATSNSFLHATCARSAALRPVIVGCPNFSTSSRARSEHREESFEEFSARYEKEFDSVQDVFELQAKRIGIKSKVENKEQYQQYLDELQPLRKELGVELKEDLYPEEKDEH